MNKFGERLRQLREEKKLTLRTLAERSNISYSFIASLEKGRFKPSRESVYALAKPLETDANELLMLAGFLPDSPVITKPAEKSQDVLLNDFDESVSVSFEKLLEGSVLFRGKKLLKEDKLAVIAFLDTLLTLKEKK
ncbi:helix-turn-helix domain-containing protein [Bacillus sp. FJAT-27231]|uniref:helix-turn-helix domain-containing protein n=1 Tax=Bacillus sp. FJAT-27231 TaxID=1679168 RepID=UPI0006708A07|nr:helix-turn-helix transcriptional regulator [Bacillus sp. FJAT-27231]